MRTSAPSVPEGRCTRAIAPVDVSLCGQQYASTPSSVRATATVPGSALMTLGSPRCGASAAACANFAENSPKDKCCDFCSIKPNVAMSQNVVAPPLPSSTSYPSGALNNVASPSRTRRTTLFTPSWRCDVPRYDDPVAASAASCSGRTFDGPDPNRPSRGRSSAGITRSGLLTRRFYEVSAAERVGARSAAGRSSDLGDAVEAFDGVQAAVGRADVLRGRPDQAPGALLLEDVRAPPGDAGAGEHRREHVRRHLGEVEDDGRPELDVGREHPVGVALLQLRQRGLLQGVGDLHPRRAELFRRTTQHPRTRVLGAVDAVTEAHQPLLRVEQSLHVTTRIALFGDLVEHLQHARRRATVQRTGQRADRAR